MLHARPHLETHSRAVGHSAVSGAAYRLGLRLYDRQRKRSYDFRKRATSGAVVFATTIAPPGAPSWATNPLELWNRVEMAEKRKDAQIARDYRVPLPIGLTDDQAAAMAMDIAEYIMRRLTTAVSVAVHRDAPVTAFGELKAAQDVGTHAHLFFPTRKILVDGEATDAASSGATGMGDKHTFLSNKATSGYFVEEANKFWAEVANRYATAAGISPDFDHRSYRRQGLNIKPQPRLGEMATALERAGIHTRRGDRVREAALITDAINRARSAHAVPFVPPIDLAREDGPEAFPPFRERVMQEGDRIVFRRDPQAPLQSNTLADRFRAQYFVNLKEGDQPEKTLVFRFVLFIDRSIQRLNRLAHIRKAFETSLVQAHTAHLDAKAAVSDFRAGWVDPDGPPGPQRTSKWSNIVQSAGQWINPPDPIEVQRQAVKRSQREQELRERVATKARECADLEQGVRPVKEAIRVERSALQRSLRQLHNADDTAPAQLLAAAWEVEREFLLRHFPDWIALGDDLPPRQEGERQGAGALGKASLKPRLPKAHR